MEEKDNIITFYLDDEDQAEFEVVAEVVYKEEKYLLVVDAYTEEDEEEEALILKETREEQEDIIYKLVENEDEYLTLFNLFQDIMEDVDLEYSNED